MRYLVVLLLITGCAIQRPFDLLPRAGAQRGAGHLNMNNNELTVSVGAESYQGRMIVRDRAAASALLVGPTGQMRCDLQFGAFFVEATGVCIDHRNAVYDILFTR